MESNVQRKIDSPRIGFLAVCFIALVCALWLAHEFSPGFMSYDTLYQYRQAMGLAALSDTHPIIMALLWRFLASVSDSNGTMLLFHQLLYWGTITLFVLLVTRQPTYRIALLLVIGFCPPLVIVSLHIWKDVGMMCALALACATLLGYVRHRHWAWLVAAALALFYAVAVRINGFIPALFLLFFLAYVAVDRLKLTGMKKAALGVLMVAGLSLSYFQGIATLNAKVTEKSYVLGTLLVWDLAEISLAKGEDVMPPYILRVGTGPVLKDLARLRVRETNYPFWAVISPFPPQEYQSQLLPDWLSVVVANPAPYLKHRGHVFLTMLGIGVPKTYYPYHPGIDNNEFGFKFNHITEQKAGSYFRGFDRLAETPFYKAWVYLLLCVVTFVITCHRLWRMQGAKDENVLAAVVALSGIANMGSLFFLAAAADYRYVIWTVFAGVISGVLLGAEMVKAWSERKAGVASLKETQTDPRAVRRL
jgi:hypothetical protein